jgi:4a-hydroxytetrahydrobiopterin dehydratase
MTNQVLTTDELTRGLSALAGDWAVEGSAIVRTIEFPAFLTAVRFIDELAPVAEELDHHPDLTLSWRTVGITLSTHSEGGVTDLDLELAARLDAIAAALR